MTKNRPDKPKFELCKAPSQVTFAESVHNTHSIYYRRITEALNTDSVIKIKPDDKYLQNQLRSQAKKMGLKLLYGELEGFLYIKPIQQSENDKRLMLMLRTPKTLLELKSWATNASIEMDIEGRLKWLASQDLAHLKGQAWTLTLKGQSHILDK